MIKEISEKEFDFYKNLQEVWTEVMNNPKLLPFKYE